MAVLLAVATSGCLSGLFAKDGCPAVLMGDPRDASALLRICDYAFQLVDDQDAIVVKALGTTPDSWASHHLAWKDIAIEPRNATVRVAFLNRADAQTGVDIPIGASKTLEAMKVGDIDLDEFVTLCEVGAGEHEVRFRFYQEADGRWDSAGGVIEIVWSDIRDC